MFDEKDLVLEAKHVTRRFPASGGRELLACSDVNLKMYRGKTLGLVGESGCGKSTFMRFLVGLDTPSEGEILFRGKDLTKLRTDKDWEGIRGAKISTIFQDPMTSLNPIRTIGSQITEVIEKHQKVSKAEAKEQAISIMERVGIQDAANRFDEYPFQYSGGMRQRIVIAIALS